MCPKWSLATPVLILLNVFLLLSMFNIWWVEEALDIQSIDRESGDSYTVRLLHLVFLSPVDTPEQPTVSQLMVYEDGEPLGPGHSVHQGIRNDGAGRFSNWSNRLYFSSSDNMDPRTNGRTYTVRYAINPPGYFFIVTISALLVSIFGLGPTLQWFALPAFFMVFGLAIVILPFELFLRTDYAKLELIGAFGNFPSQIVPTLNSKGYRDGEHAVQKLAGQVRILLLGDSMTFGSGIADDEIYPRLLGEMAGPEVEIITLAQNGWQTADELRAFRREGLAYDPDLVLIGVVTNDPGPLSTEPPGQQPEWVILRRLPLDLQFWRFGDYHVNRLGDISGLRYSYHEWERDIYDPAKRYRKKWEETVKEFGSVLKSKQIPAYAFVLISPVNPTSVDQIQKYRTLYQEFSGAGFRTFNLHEAYLAEFKDVQEKELWALPDDGHPGPEINRFFAREIWRELQPPVSDLLAKRSSPQSVLQNATK